MIDIQIIRERPEFVQEKSAQKGYKIDAAAIVKLDSQRRELLQKVEKLRQQRNEISTQMKGGKPEPALVEQGKIIKQELSELEKNLETIESDLNVRVKKVPNLPLDDVPFGASEDENVVSKTVGEIPQFDFTPKNHAEIAEAKGWLDKERAAKVAGARFAYIKGDLVLLWQALVSYAMAQLGNEQIIARVIAEQNLSLSSKPFTPIMPPYMIKTDLYDAMDRLEPSDDRYKIEGEELWLQGSAEHVLGSMHADEIIASEQLPLRYMGFATSFRKEAGTYGRDMEGIIRMHQFDKLEMESITTAETSFDEHLLQIGLQEHLMQQLQLPYQLVMKCTADIGKPYARGVDIDAWLPGQDKYRETHTADYMTDYQARRLNTRYRDEVGVSLVHTNDATAFSQRPLIAIIENYQTADGDVVVPEVLRPFMGGREKI